MIDLIINYGKVSIDRIAYSTNTLFVEYGVERQIHLLSIINLAFLIDTMR